MVTMTQRTIELLTLADVTLLAARLFVSPAKQPDGGPVPDESARAGFEAGIARLGGGRLMLELTAVLDEAHRGPRDVRRAEWNRLFEGAVHCPINETAYVRRDKGGIIGDICGFYRAFGFEPDSASGEKADHLVTELQFVAILLVMLASAEAGRRTDEASITAAALRAFLADHTGEWIRLFSARLRSCSRPDLYGRAASLLEAWWSAMAGRFDLRPFERLDDTLGDVADGPDDTPYECDMADAAPPSFVPLTGPHTSAAP